MTLQTCSIDPLAIIAEYYSVGTAAYDLLVGHCRDVSEMALEIARNKPELHLDRTFIFEAAMLHDIGMFLTDAPEIYCYGREPYIKHGILGAQLLRQHNLPFHALVAERHTSSGLTHTEIVVERLPLPLDRSYLPESLEEKLICYADCFFSKTHPHEKKSVDKIVAKMAKVWKKYGLKGEPLSVKRFEVLHQLFAQ